MRAGTTLIELMVVLMILAIVGIVTIPAFARLRTTDAVTDAADTLATVLRGGRAEALAEGRVVTVTLDPSTGTYWVVGAGDSVRATGRIPLTDSLRMPVAEARLDFTFSPSGGAVGDSVPLIAPERAAMITVDHWTGAVGVRVQ